MIAELHTALGAHAPITGVSIGRMNDRATWRIDFADGATEQQRAAAQAALRAFDVLASVKATASALVDAAAERARLAYITEGAGQALTYQRKSNERMAYLSAVQSGAPITSGMFPMLSASVGVEVPATGDAQADLGAVAALIGEREAAFATIGAQIEKLRLQAKAAVTAATTAEGVRAAATVVWP